MKEHCIVPNMEHNFEFVVASFGTQLFICILCHQIQDVVEDAQA